MPKPAIEVGCEEATVPKQKVTVCLTHQQIRALFTWAYLNHLPLRPSASAAMELTDIADALLRDPDVAEMLQLQDRLKLREGIGEEPRRREIRHLTLYELAESS